MTVLVTYLSLSGQTKKIAEAIYEEIETEKEIKPISEVENLEGYDFAFIGTPVHSFGPDNNVRMFLKKQAKGKKIAMFVTHAMPPGMEMLKGILAKCKKAANQANLIGFFDCQGEMAEDIAKSLMESGNPQLAQFGKMREVTIGHPDADEIYNARIFAKEIMEKVK
ncbi:MAG: flavodoxin family protein [Promethearchaeota archaeon]